MACDAAPGPSLQAHSKAIRTALLRVAPVLGDIVAGQPGRAQEARKSAARDWLVGHADAGLVTGHTATAWLARVVDAVCSRGAGARSDGPAAARRVLVAPDAGAAAAIEVGARR